MKGKTRLLIALCLGLVVAVQAQIQRPAAWLRADSAVLGAPSWNDVSENGLYAVPSSGSMPAVFSRMNFNKCFEVGGTETYSLPLGINDTRQSDVIVVYETYDTLGENALWQIRIDSAKRIGQTTQRILNDNGRITYDTANRLKPVINYLAQSWRAPEVCAPTLTLCGADSLQLHGRIAEALYFDRRISDTAVIQWISCLAVKYGVTLSQTDYIDSRRNVIWDFTHYPDYCASIAGVGRDDSAGLCQKQTYFADNRMVFGINGLAQTNEENSAAIADGDFILLGTAGDLSSISELYMQDGTACEVFGRGMAQVTGNAHNYATFILLDTAAVHDSIAPVLLIDRSGTGEFPAGEIGQVLCSGTDSLGHYVFPNIHWDTDLNGRDFFCFAVAMSDTTGTPKALMVAGSGDGKTPDNMAKDGRGDAPWQVSTTHYKVLPNPNHGDFTVEIGYPEAQDVSVTVHDADGRLLLTMGGRGQSSYRFEGTVGTAGQYLIDIVSPSDRKTLKMVVN
jgi:hypothetical protein